MTGTAWRIRLSTAADKDFVDILQWTEERFGPMQAETYRTTLIDALTAIATRPDLAGSWTRDDILPGLRSLHVARNGARGRHLILYRVAELPDVIDIIRILHDAMDLPRHLPGDSGL